MVILKHKTEWLAKTVDKIINTFILSKSSGFQNQWKPGLIVIITIIIVSQLINHTPGLNGPWYWQWPWRSLYPLRVYTLLSIGLIPFVIAQIINNQRKGGSFLHLSLLCFSFLLFQYSGIGAQRNPFDLTLIWKIVMHPGATGYYTDAINLYKVDNLLSLYPKFHPNLHVHSLTKPPGLIMYYILMIKWFGPYATAAVAGGIFISILACGSIFAIFFFVQIFGGSKNAAFCGASLFVLCSGPVLFFPEFDQIYPVFSCGVLGLWCLALNQQSIIRSSLYSSACGIALGFICFFVYHLLVLGTLFIGIALYFTFNKNPFHTFKKVLIAGCMVLVTFTLTNMLFSWLTGYNPIITFKITLAIQELLLKNKNLITSRPYYATILFDLLDFFLGTNWIILIPAFLFFMSYRNQQKDSLFLMSCAFISQIFIVSLSGLLQAETARVWIFLIPLLIFPACIELARWKIFPKIVFYVCMWLILSAICQNMTFISV